MNKHDILIPVEYWKLSKQTRAAIRAAAISKGVLLSKISDISFIITQSPASIKKGLPPYMMFLHIDSEKPELLEIPVKLLRKRFHKFREKYISPKQSKSTVI